MQLLSKEKLLQAAEFQPLARVLSIYKNFSLGRLCIALHNKPGEGVFGSGNTAAQ